MGIKILGSGPVDQWTNTQQKKKKIKKILIFTLKDKFLKIFYIFAKKQKSQKLFLHSPKTEISNIFFPSGPV